MICLIGTSTPEVDHIINKFRFVYTFAPVPTSGDFRIDINETAKAELIEQYEANFKNRIEDAMREVWDRLHECLTHMSDRLANDESGKRKGFHATMLGNAKELIKPPLPLRGPKVIAAAVVNLKQDSEPRRNGKAVT